MDIVLGERELLDRINVGYVGPRDQARAELVSASKRAISISLGQGNDPPALCRPRFSSFCPALRSDSALICWNAASRASLARASSAQDRSWPARGTTPRLMQGTWASSEHLFQLSRT